MKQNLNLDTTNKIEFLINNSPQYASIIGYEKYIENR